MEMVLKAHHCGVSRLAKASSRWMLEHVMDKPPKLAKPSQSQDWKSPSLEVHVMYEPSRLAQQCLQDAYACLIPTMRRRLGLPLSSISPAPSSAERNAQ
jgi:hypothetical protein